METTPSPLRISLWWTCLAFFAAFLAPYSAISQCDTEVSGVFTYCNAIGTPGTTGYFVAFRVFDPTGDTLNVVDLDGNNITNRGKRVDDINTQNEPATVTVAQLMISGIGADSLEYWYFGPYDNDSTFNIALVDPNNVCDTIFVASGSYDCMDNSGISDPGACDNDVPLYFLDFSQTEFEYGGGGGGNENFDEIFLIMPRTRESLCCDLQPANQSCFEFIIRLADQDIGLAIDDVGSGSPGGEIYADTLNMFECTDTSAVTWPFTQSGGQSQDLPLCLLGGGGQEFVVLSCKSGGNVTGASIDALSNIFAPPVVTTEPCNAFLEVFNADTVMWSSPDDPNLNNLLSCTGDSIFCTFLYDTMTFGEITSCQGDTFTYIVGSMPADNECFNADTLLYDTTYVVVFPVFTVAIDSMCNATGDSLILTANVSSAAIGCEYAYTWSTGDTTQTITVPFSSTEYFVSVTRGDVSPDLQECSIATDSIVAEGGLGVSCENIADTLYTCITELPEPDTTLVIITGCSNANPLIYVEDVSNNGDGCIGDTLIITRYYIVDADGDTITTTTDRDTCIQLLSFVDDVSPVISACPADVTVTCASEVPVPAPETVTASDNCGQTVIVSHGGDSVSNQICPNQFTVTRIYIATDNCGNTSSCTQIINVFDNVAPSITCPADITVECADLVPAASTTTVISSDNCGGGVTLMHEGDVITDMTCADRFIITRTYSATDSCGNTATCAQIITVFDDTPPSITCPANVTVQCASDVPAVNLAAVVASDNCGGIASITHAGDNVTDSVCINRFTITRIYQATDSCGNTATCAQIILVADNTVPVITCPANVTIDCTEGSMPGTTGTATATDNCNGSPDVSFTDSGLNGLCPATFIRTWTAVDECGNSATCTQAITINDDVAPVITCPADTIIDCTSSTDPASTGSATATDDCTATPLVVPSDITTAGQCPQEYTITRTWTASDICGNTATCVQTITVIDTIAPTIICPADVTIEPGEGPFVPVIDFGILGDFALFTAAGAFDNLGPTSVAGDIGTHVGTITGFPPGVVIGQMHEANGVTAQAATDVAVAYGQLAAMTCGTVLGTTLGNGQVLTPDIYCLGAASTVNLNLVLDAQDDPNAVFIFQIDGALSTGAFSNVILINGASACNVYWQVNGAFATGTNSIFRGNLFVQGAISLNFGSELEGRALSTAGAISTNSNIVNAITPCSSEDISMATAADICDSSVVIIYTDTIMGDVCCGETVVTRTWIATDDCGNSSSCIQTITVADTAIVTIICPADITVNNGDDTSPQNTGEPLASDNCGGTPGLTSSDNIVEGECDGDYTIIRTWIATDECGNTNSCQQNIDVEGACNVDLSLIKELDPGQGAVAGGDDVDFTITVTNEGLFPVGSITIIDYIPDGFILNDPDWTAGMEGSTGQSATIVLSIANGELAAGGLQSMQSVSVQITLQAEADITPGIYINIAEISFVLDTSGNDVTNNDIDSDPDTDDTNDPGEEDDHDPASICVLPSPVIVGDLFVCSGDTATYSVLNFNAANIYEWLLSGGGIIIEDNDSSIVVAWTSAPGGPFVISVTETSGPDCSASGSLSVFIQGGEALACLDHVNLSIDNECGTVVTSGMILTGDQAGNNSYIVYVIDMNGDTVPNATLTWMHVGQTFKVSVVSECSGQSCWGFLTVEDKLPPVIDCVCPVGSTAGTCVISCLQVADFLAGEIPLEFHPTVLDNCGGSTIEIVDINLNFEPCSGGYIRVTWLATDAAGNTSTCMQEFIIVPLTLETLEFPADYFGDCDDSSDPSVTGWPQIDGVDLSNIPGLCNIIATYTDNVFDLCGGGRKIIRTWKVFDWCVPVTREFTQFIILADDEGPVLTCPDNLIVGTDVWYCHANVLVPKPAVSDACSAIKTFHLFSPEGTVVSAGSNFFINELPLGTHTVTWTVYDECHNSSQCSFDITIIDNVPPVPSCQAHLVVSLTNDRPNGITLVPADAFDDGSFDNCSPVSFRARRMDSCIDFDWTTGGACVDDIPGGIPAVSGKDRGTDHGICVPFACCDIGAGPIMVELEVTDTAGNVNYCMVEIQVQDKLAPVITCPPTLTISCEFEVDVVEGIFSDINGNNDGTLDEDPLSEIFGNMYDAFRHEQSDRGNIVINDPGNIGFPQPYNWGIEGWATDNCEVNLSVEVSQFEDCSGQSLPGDPPPGAVGLITRRFVAVDASGNPSAGSCLQRIWIIDFNPFFITDTTCANINPLDGVIWPCDVELNACPEDLTETGEPIIFDDHCNIIGVAFEDSRFDFADGTCYKVLREWSVIDWCQFDPNTGAGIWSYTQTIKVLDSEGPEMLDCPQAPLELCLNDQGITLPANNQVFLGENDPNASSCSVHVVMSQTVRELCSSNVIYDVKLYPFNGSEFIQIKPATVLALDANHEGEMSFNTQESSMQSISEDGLPYNNPLCGDYHRLVWTIEDGCGNLSFCDHLFRLEDCKDPTPVCIDGLSSMIMTMDGQVTIWASDFDASSFDDCTPSEALLFSFSGAEYQPSFTYTCDNVPVIGEPFEVEIWVADGGADQNCNGVIEWSERNTDFCITTLIITDENNVCDGEGIMLVGEVMTEDINAISQAVIKLTGPNGALPEIITGADGKFTFTDVLPGYDYVIKPERNDDHKNGVSTLDLVGIQKHLLGKELFTSPYQYIAADANSSGSVSAIDLIEIRKLILGIYNTFPSNNSWRFVKEGSPMEANHPWPFEEIIEINNLPGEEMDQLDFVGVKIGDINNTVIANALQIVPRSARPLINIEALAKSVIKTGDLLEIQFVIPEVISGFQWTFETKSLEFVAIRSNDIVIDESNIGLIDDGLLTMSWNGDLVSGTEKPSFTMVFKARSSGMITEMIRMTSAVTAAEAYSVSGNILDVKLAFTEAVLAREYALYQNQPNPWNGYTLIGFDLPENASAVLTVYDVAGKILKSFTGDYKAGYNSVLLTSRDISGPGIFYYRLESGSYSATKKMIIQ